MHHLARARISNFGLLIAATCMVLAVVISLGRITSSEQASRRERILPAWHADEVSRISLRRHGSKLVLSREPKDEAGNISWRMRGALSGKADDFAVGKLLEGLEYASFDRRVDAADVDRARFGLSSPASTIEVEMAALSYRLQIGGPAPSPKGSVYVELTGSDVAEPRVFVIDEHAHEKLNLTFQEFRGRALSPYLLSDLKGLEFTGQGGKRRLKRLQNGRWYFDAMHGGVRVSPDAFQAVKLQFSRIQLDPFVDLNQATEASKAADGRVTLSLEPTDFSRPKAILEFGGRCPGDPEQIIAIRRQPLPVAGCVQASILPAFQAPAEQWFDQTPFAFQPDEVERIEVHEGQTKLQLRRKGGSFELLGKKTTSVALESGNQRLEKLVHTRGKLQPDPEAVWKSQQVRGTVQMVGLLPSGTEETKERIQFTGVDPSGGFYIRRDDDGAVLWMNGSTARAFSTDATLLRDHALLGFEEKDLRSIEIDGPNLSQSVTQDKKGSYTLIEPKGYPHDAGLISSLVRELGQLKALRWVSATEHPEHGLDNPRYRLRIELAGEKQPVKHELRVGQRAPGGAFATLDDDEAVFVLSKETLRKIQTPFISRSLFMLDRDRFERIQLKAHGATLSLRRHGAGFVPEDELSPLTPSEVEAVIEALGSLRAEAAVHLGRPRPEEGFSAPNLEVVAIPAAEDKHAEPLRFRIGAGDAYDGISIYYARVQGTDATFVVPRSQVQPIIDVL